MIGITYQNIITNLGDDKEEVKTLEIPNPSFAFSFEIIKDIVKNSSNIEKLKNLWVFKIKDEKLNKLISWDLEYEAKY